MGRIGTAVARRAKAFGLSIHYHNRKRVNPATEDELEATYWESLDQMLARVDIVSVNCPSTPATFHLLSARRKADLSKRDAGVDQPDRSRHEPAGGGRGTAGLDRGQCARS